MEPRTRIGNATIAGNPRSLLSRRAQYKDTRRRQYPDQMRASRSTDLNIIFAVSLGAARPVSAGAVRLDSRQSANWSRRRKLNGAVAPPALTAARATIALFISAESGCRE